MRLRLASKVPSIALSALLTVCAFLAGWFVGRRSVSVTAVTQQQKAELYDESEIRRILANDNPWEHLDEERIGISHLPFLLNFCLVEHARAPDQKVRTAKALAALCVMRLLRVYCTEPLLSAMRSRPRPGGVKFGSSLTIASYINDDELWQSILKLSNGLPNTTPGRNARAKIVLTLGQYHLVRALPLCFDLIEQGIKYDRPWDRYTGVAAVERILRNPSYRDIFNEGLPEQDADRLARQWLDWWKQVHVSFKAGRGWNRLFPTYPKAAEHQRDPE